ncbi:MAG: PAS domain S-box protein [Alphaproteobacteria bacterium]|nr:PAS domain S-box protein [Alphaproteobacteria bacterium]
MEKNRSSLAHYFSSVGGKILLFACLTAFLTSIMIGGYFYVKTTGQEMRIQISDLATERKSVTPLLQSAFNELNTNINVLARTPPVQGIIRATENNGIDPQDGSTTQLWKSRLETIFTSMIGVVDSYVQIRYIGMEDNARELVRINRKNDIITRVPSEALQQKGEEFYVREAAQTPPGKTYFSTVSLNREHGKVEEPFLPVIRAAVPIYKENGPLFGMIVINVSYEKILGGVLKKLKSSRDLYIINQKGDFIVYKNKESAPHFHFGGLDKTPPAENPIIAAILKSPEKQDTLHIEDDGIPVVINYSKNNFIPFEENRTLTIAIVAPRDILLGPVYKIRNNFILLTTMMVLLASASAALFSNLLVQPLNKMIAEIRAYGHGREKLDLPVTATDEIGELARAFDDMKMNLEQARLAETKVLTRLQAIVDNTVDGLITINEKAEIIDYNKACEKIFGYTPEEIIGKNIKTLMPDHYAEKHEDYLKNYHETGVAKIIGKGREVEGKRKDGTIFPLDLSVSEVSRNGEKRLYSGIVRDITLRKQAEEEIMRSNEELEHFAYIASHDLQEPLRMVSNFTRILDEEYGENMDQQARQYMNFITEAAQRMQHMVSDLLEYSRIGSSSAGFEEFESREQIGIALQLLKDTIEETGATVTSEPMPALLASPVRFSRLIQNLVGNALKYSPKDRPPVIHIAVTEEAENWLFSVKDNGIGIREEFLEQIFIIFRRLHGKNEYAGRGMGLAVCKKIVESFGGKIWAESEFGKGSTFFFTIPKPQQARKVA